MFEREKAEHSELYEQQQAELRGMMEGHRTQNEEWLERMRNENDAERRALAEERVSVCVCVCVCVCVSYLIWRQTDGHGRHLLILLA